VARVSVRCKRPTTPYEGAAANVTELGVHSSEMRQGGRALTITINYRSVLPTEAEAEWNARRIDLSFARANESSRRFNEINEPFEDSEMTERAPSASA